MIRTLAPVVDTVFKKIFGIEANKDLLISLINSIVRKEDQVVDIQLLNPYRIDKLTNYNFSILDIKALDSEGKWFNIEIQIRNTPFHEKRILHYICGFYSDQLSEEKLEYEALT